MNTEWKPIASAPKDGSEFLACYGRQGNVLQLVKWNKIHGYFESKGKPELGFTSNATDWMPVSAPTSHPIPTGATGEDTEQVRHKMNADLCAFYMRWEAHGDYLRCRKCRRPQIASYAEKGFPHAAGCKAVGNVEQRPWLALVELMRPLIGSVAPAAGDAPAWHGLTDAERDGFVGEIADYGTDFVSPLYAVVENIERRLRDKNAAIAQQPQRKEA